MAFNLLGLIPGAMSLLGGLFGNQTNQTQGSNQNTSGSSQQGGTSSTNQQNTSTGTTNQTQTQNTQSNTTDKQNSTSTSNETGSVLGSVNEAIKGTTTGAVTRLDAATTDMLRQGVQQMMGTLQGNQQIVQNEMTRIGGSGAFDVDGFVKGITSGAAVDIGGQRESNTNQTRSTIGASGKSNSAAALLESRIARDAANSLAGVEANARATGEQIAGNRSATLGNLAGIAANDFNSMLGALLQAGETQTTNQQQTSTNTSSQNSSNTSTGNTSVTGTQTNNTNTTGTTNQTSNQTDNTVQNTVQTQQGTQNQQTVGKGSTNQNSLNWGDFFKTVGSAFGATF